MYLLLLLSPGPCTIKLSRIRSYGSVNYGSVSLVLNSLRLKFVRSNLSVGYGFIKFYSTRPWRILLDYFKFCFYSMVYRAFATYRGFSSINHNAIAKNTLKFFHEFQSQLLNSCKVFDTKLPSLRCCGKTGIRFLST